jgi:quercetin dioxygenase-like cupin family protein
MDNTIVRTLDDGVVLIGSRQIAVQDLPWEKHKEYKGVYVKHLVIGEDTDGRFSCHIIRMDAGAVIGDHAHAGALELNEVLGGAGTGTLECEEFSFVPGVVALIPESRAHGVIAGKEGLYFLAKFVPALI